VVDVGKLLNLRSDVAKRSDDEQDTEHHSGEAEPGPECGGREHRQASQQEELSQADLAEELAAR
jgi:hypothetical protein